MSRRALLYIVRFHFQDYLCKIPLEAAQLNEAKFERKGHKTEKKVTKAKPIKFRYAQQFFCISIFGRTAQHVYKFVLHAIKQTFSNMIRKFADYKTWKPKPAP